MAHSYIHLKKEEQERVVSVTDSILYVFIYLFLDTLEKKPSKESEEYRIISHYKMELNQTNFSFISLKLDEINSSDNIRNWYLEILGKLNCKDMSLDFLNSLGLSKIYGKPIPAIKIESLINDIMWILHVPKIEPSGVFKFYVKDQTQNTSQP